MATRNDDRPIVVFLCVVAAFRTFLFGAAFPFFSNVDEQGHFDLVSKYARGHIPGGLEHWDAIAAESIVLYDTPEYLDRPEQYPGGAYPPPHRLATPDDRKAFERQVLGLVASENHESTQPPVYYVVAGAWYGLGRAIGLKGGHALYWLRFLNVLVSGALTWLAYVVARIVFPDRRFLRLGVPLLVASLPQDAMYLVNNDSLLPLINGAAFACLLLVCRDVSKGVAFHVGTGLLVAAAVLVKFSSVALLPVCTGMVVSSVLKRDGSANRRADVARGALLLAAAALPIGAWCARNYLVLGDVTGSLAKTQYLGWTQKPLGEMLDHPLFTLSGMTLFWQGTLATFWRGELVWGSRPIASAGWDRFYGVSSFVFIAAAMIAPWTWRKDLRAGHRCAAWPSLALFLLSLAFLAAISVLYDFGDCFYPSRAMPYMTSGRLASGSLIPFAILYVTGLDALLPRRIPDSLRFVALIVPVVLMTVSEFVMTRMVFSSAHNWFHMI